MTTIDSISQLGATTRTYAYDIGGRPISCSSADAALEYEYRGNSIGSRLGSHRGSGARAVLGTVSESQLCTLY